MSGQFSALLDVDVTKTVGPVVPSGGIFMSGGLLTYTVTVQNNGVIPVTGTLTDIWPTTYLTNNNAYLSSGPFYLGTGTTQTFVFTGNLLSDSLSTFTNTAVFDWNI